jgi:flagellar biosynthesis protein FlhF
MANEAAERAAHASARPDPAAAKGVQTACVRALFEHGVPDQVAVALAAHAGRLADGEPVAALARAFEARMSFKPLPPTPERPVLLVGAPGAGKSSTAARLAAKASLAGAGADLVCADPDREASRAQLEVYADVLSARGVVAPTPAMLTEWARGRDDTRAAFIDAPSVNPYSNEDMTRLAELARASGADPVLVFDAGIQPRDLADQAALFGEIGVRRAVATRTDIARRVGGIVAVGNTGLSLAAFSASPFVASGLTPATPLRLARLILDDVAALAAQPDNNEGEWR